jgi:hypothetical protein
MIASADFGTVSSSLTRSWPAATTLPSRTCSSPTTPPVGCWTFLTSLRTTSWPAEITAPENSVVAAQPPKPSTSTPAEMAAIAMWRRSEPMWS